MRKLIALVFNYSLNGLLADEGTEYWNFCFELLDQHGGPDHDEQSLDFLQSAYAHIYGRTAYEGIAAHRGNPDDPWADIMNAGRKVVFSRTLKTADWANTTIAAGDTAEEIDKLRQGGDGHIIVWGGVSFWRSLMRLDLIDEWHRLDLVSSTAARASSASPCRHSTANRREGTPGSDAHLPQPELVHNAADRYERGASHWARTGTPQRQALMMATLLISKSIALAVRSSSEPVTGIEPALSAWEVVRFSLSRGLTLRRKLFVSDRARPLVAGVNGPAFRGADLSGPGIPSTPERGPAACP